MFDIDLSNSMSCCKCGKPVFDIDALCDNCRRREYDTHKCSRCEKMIPSNTTGWYVPSFRSYIDTQYYCPDCITFYHQDYIRKNKRLSEITEEKKKLDAEYPTLPSGDYLVTEEDGEYYVDPESGLSLSEFQKAVDEYEKNKIEILHIREIRDEYWRRVKDLQDEEQECRLGNGFDIKANR